VAVHADVVVDVSCCTVRAAQALLILLGEVDRD